MVITHLRKNAPLTRKPEVRHVADLVASRRDYLPTVPVKISWRVSPWNVATIQPPPRRPLKLPVALAIFHAAPCIRLYCVGAYWTFSVPS
jgi:hypothetical protein